MIRKIVGIITLIGCSIFIGCEDEIIIASEDISSETVSFNVRLPIDENGYYHLDMDESNWQTLHRVSGSVNTIDGNPVEFFWIEWESDLYWYLGDTLGYIINRNFNSRCSRLSLYETNVLKVDFNLFCSRVPCNEVRASACDI